LIPYKVNHLQPPQKWVPCNLPHAGGGNYPYIRIAGSGKKVCGTGH